MSRCMVLCQASPDIAGAGQNVHRFGSERGDRLRSRRDRQVRPANGHGAPSAQTLEYRLDFHAYLSGTLFQARNLAKEIMLSPAIAGVRSRSRSGCQIVLQTIFGSR
jgi:hypothetical protein